jgi:hypothetical protein
MTCPSRELLVEVLLQRGALGGVAHPVECCRADLERMPLGLHAGQRRFEARRLQKQHLVQLADELANHVAHAQVLALLHHQRLDVVE